MLLCCMSEVGTLIDTLDLRSLVNFNLKNEGSLHAIPYICKLPVHANCCPHKHL